LTTAFYEKESQDVVSEVWTVSLATSSIETDVS
jgi:hypothetical protein